MDQTAIDKALREATENLPPDAKVVAIEGEDYEDSESEDSILIRVFLDNSVSDEDLAKLPTSAIKDSVRTSLSKNGIFVFAYFEFARRDESNVAAGGGGNG